ncbi:MAG: hypothetical protein AAFQ07_12045 [Chloroflexota bacterium]
MSRIKFKIRLKHVHDKTGLSPYAVAKEVAPSENTVRKYVDEDEVISTYIPNSIVELCNFYGVDWRDPTIVEAIMEEPSEEIRKTPTAA